MTNADAGYKGTAVILAESAMCLVEGANEQIGGAPVLMGGALTPASAFGGALVKRLNATPYIDITVT